MEQSSTKYRKRFLPSEIIVLILLRLPVKPLGRFKLVSKTWNSIISHPRFIKTHTHSHLTHNPKKLIALSKTTASLCSIDLTINSSHTLPATVTELTFISPTIRWNNILGSCNGLVLAGVVKGRVYLMNPTTHEAWKLPKNPFEPEYPVNPFVVICDIRYGFGYDSSTDDYKVVCICFYSRCNVLVESVSVYSVRDALWRELASNAVPHAQPSYYSSSCALVDGKCHWCAHSSSIIAFSFTDEVFSEIGLPESLRGEDLSRDVVEIGGKLAVYSSTMDASSGVEGGNELWVMQEYGDAKSWTRVCSHRKYWRMPVCLVEGCDQDIVIQNRYRDGVVVFNIVEKKFRNVRIIGCPSKFSSIGGTFVESIESIERISSTS